VTFRLGYFVWVLASLTRCMWGESYTMVARYWFETVSSPHDRARAVRHRTHATRRHITLISVIKYTDWHNTSNFDTTETMGQFSWERIKM